MTTVDDITERLTEVRPPGFGANVVALGAIRGIDTDGGTVTIHLVLPAMPGSSITATMADIRRAVGALDGVHQVNVVVPGAAPAAGGAVAHEAAPVPGVRDIVAVASTKGGVGKSTVATNLALALQHLGLRVGLLDADVYGPSIPIMLGVTGRPRVTEDKRIFPLEKYGLRLMSVGFFLDDDSPVIWRGPLVMGLVRQFLKDVEWGELDVLLIDLPPGTGDAQLTLVQQVPITGGVVVTTPQDVATLDVERGIAMFQHLNTPVFGIIENMSYYDCPSCGQREDVFGVGGGDRIAARAGVPVLGHIPLVPEVRAGGDAGQPIVLTHPEHPISRLFDAMARQVVDAIELEHAATAPPTIIG
jgi:ATP-binding protein involved in chromosome partitioning